MNDDKACSHSRIVGLFRVDCKLDKWHAGAHQGLLNWYDNV